MTAQTFMQRKRKSRRGQVKLTPRQTAQVVFLALVVLLCVLCALYLSMRPALAR